MFVARSRTRLSPGDVLSACVRRLRVEEFVYKTHDSKRGGKIIRAYSVSAYSPTTRISFNSSTHTHASLVRAIDKTFGAVVADTIFFTGTRSDVQCTITFSSVECATMALVDMISRADMTYAVKPVRGDRVYIEFEGKMTRVQFKQAKRVRSPSKRSSSGDRDMRLTQKKPRY